MQRVRARLADEAWLPFLAGQRGEAVVESGSRHAVNVRIAGGDLLWIAADGAALAPNALLTDATELSRMRPGQSVRVIGAAGLAVGPLVIDLQDCRTFSCQASACNPVGARLRAGLTAAATVLDRHGVAGGMLHRADTPTGPLAEAMHTRLLTGAGRLQAAVSNRSVTDAVAAARTLIGLGIGSTPSGDDYLLGCLAVLFLHVRTRSFGRELSHGLRLWSGDTTPVSRSYLLAAYDGRFHIDLTNAVTTIFLGEPDTIGGAVQRVLAHGATSGTDAVVGMLDTVKTVAFHGFRAVLTGLSTAPATPRAGTHQDLRRSHHASNGSPG